MSTSILMTSPDPDNRVLPVRNSSDMKTLYFTIGYLLLALFTVRAELAIYNFTGTQSVVGNSSEAKLRVSGVIIIDLDTGQATRVIKFRAGGVKRFAIGDESNFAVYRSQGHSSTTALVLSGQTIPIQGGQQETRSFYVGKDTLLSTGPRLVTLPRTVKGSGYTLIDNGAPLLPALSTQTIIHTFSTKETTLANARLDTIDNAASRWRGLLLEQGYIP
jgi:hypothetical protein